MTPFWKSCARIDHVCGSASLSVLSTNGPSAAVTMELAKTCRTHYVSRKWLATFGRKTLATKLATVLPVSKRQRSGDLGEILACEYVNRKEWGYEAPVLRLRWKDGRELAMRGDDVIGFDLSVSPVGLLKGESKSRAALADATLKDIRKALRRNKGRPSAHTIAFIVDQLVDAGKIKLARRIEGETAGARLLSKRQLAHLHFVFCGNDPTALLQAHLTPLNIPGITQLAVAIHCKDHQATIGKVYSEAARA